MADSFGHRALKSIQGGKRLMIFGGSIIVLAVSGYYLASSDTPPAASEIRVPPNNIKNVQGSQAPTQDMQRLLASADKTRQEKALTSGTSAMPTIVAEPIKPVEMPVEDRNKQAELNGLARPEPPLARPTITPPMLPVAPIAQPMQVNQSDDNLAELMKRQMEQIAKMGFGPANVSYFYKTDQTATGAVAPSLVQAQTAAAGAADLVDNPANGVPTSIGGQKLPLPGTIVYGEMVSAANSDAPGPVLAKVLQGEFAGATLIGQFETKRDALVISFKTMTVRTLPDGTEVNKSVAINAVAVDTVNIGTAMVTDVDHHLLNNVGFTAAAAFAQGLGQAIQQQGSTIVQGVGGTTITNPAMTVRNQLYVGGGAAGAAAGQALNTAFGNRPATITVASQTPMGILFLPTQGNQ